MCLVAKLDHLSSLLLSDFIMFCSFILSHPLYLSYFIFFSPYLFKIFSFLSPIFITTTLLVVAFLTLTLTASPLQFPESKASFLQTLLQTLSSKVEDQNEELQHEVYKMVFETTEVENENQTPQQAEAEDDDHSKEDDESREDYSDAESREDCLQIPMESECETLRNEKPVARPETNQVRAVVKLFEDFLQEKEGVENMLSKKRQISLSVDPNKASEAVVHKLMTNGSKETTLGRVAVESCPKVKVDDSDQNESKSMRKEKEWRRTLACKLFEERHGGAGEGMDLLWETYDQSESDDSNNKVKMQLKSSNSKKSKGLGNYNYLYEDDDSDGQLCCLQALKFSTGKMNLGMGMGRPNLVKISKALKGIGWLHHLTKHGNGKKGYH